MNARNRIRAVERKVRISTQEAIEVHTEIGGDRCPCAICQPMTDEQYAAYHQGSQTVNIDFGLREVEG